MTDRLDVVQWNHSPNGKAFPKRIGTAMPKKNKPGEYRLYLDALPMPSLSRDKDKMECVVELLVPRERDDTQQSNAPAGRPFDDDIQF